MNRQRAKLLAKIITSEELLQMFQNAKNQITNWNEISKINKSLTKANAWNILAKDFRLNDDYHFIAKFNMIREFGDFLPEKLKPAKKNKIKPQINLHHEVPDFSNSLFNK